MLNHFFAAISGRSRLFVPLGLVLVLVAGVLTVRAGPPPLPGSADAPAAATPARLAGGPSPAGPLLAQVAPDPATSNAPPVAGGSPAPGRFPAPDLSRAPEATPTPDLTPTPDASPTPTAQPTATSPPAPRIRPTATARPDEWLGRALAEVIIREKPTVESVPMGLLLTGETAIIDEVTTGHEVERGNWTWYRVHSGLMAGYVYGALFEPGPNPAGAAPPNPAPASPPAPDPLPMDPAPASPSPANPAPASPAPASPSPTNPPPADPPPADRPPADPPPADPSPADPPPPNPSPANPPETRGPGDQEAQ